MTLCDKCKGQLKIKTALVELEEGEGATEIEIEFCPECKLITEISICGYTTEW